MELFYILLSMAGGACTPTQAGINSQLRLWTGDTALAALISFAVGTLALFMYVLVLRISWPAFRSAVELPWWIWTGGLLGAFLVAVTVIVATKLGAATMVASLVAGQMLTSLLLDHYGLIGYELKETTLWRVIGAFLVVSGVVLIRKF